MSRFPVAPLLLSLVLASPTDAGDVPMPPEFKPVRDFIDGGMVAGQSPSLAVAVVKGDRVIWAEGFGFANVEDKIAATSDSIYLLASVSKPMTATGLMVLVDRGLVDLDRPVNGYLPGARIRACAGKADEMTVRRLANHTSGLPIHYNFYHDRISPLPWDETIRRYGFAAHAPGSRWEYSNLGFGILGYVTEVASKRPWREFLEKEVFDPLGMTRTSDRARPGLEAEATVQYAPDAAGRFLRVEPYGFDHPGASALWSSAGDTARFVRMHLGGGILDGTRLLREESVQAMQRMTGRSGPDAGTGIGWAVGTHMGQRCFWHSGGMPGVSTIVRAYPGAGCATVVLANTHCGNFTSDVADRLAKVLLPGGAPPRGGDGARPLDFSPEAPQDQVGGTLVLPAARSSGETSAELRGVWEGRLQHFDGDISLRLIVKDDGNVEVSFNGRRAGRLRDAKLRESGLTGRIVALIRTQRGFHGVPELEFRLERDGDRMTGVVVAMADGYFALSHWVEIERKRGVRV